MDLWSQFLELAILLVVFVPSWAVMGICGMIIIYRNKRLAAEFPANGEEVLWATFTLGPITFIAIAVTLAFMAFGWLCDLSCRCCKV